MAEVRARRVSRQAAGASVAACMAVRGVAIGVLKRHVAKPAICAHMARPRGRLYETPIYVSIQ